MEKPAVGFLHITRDLRPIDPVHAEYRIVFAPLGGRFETGMRVPRP
jgi:hypothetical protein